MKVVYIKFLLLFLLAFHSVSFGSSAPTCGFTKQCPDGLACVGSIGKNNSGICVLTGPQIALCKLVLYLDGSILLIFGIFALVMLAFSFWLGKTSWGLIISVLIGFGGGKAAVTIIKSVSGQEEGYCTSDIISYSSLIGQTQGAACFSDTSLKLGTRYIYNISDAGIGNACVTPLACIKKTCVLTGLPALATVRLYIKGVDTGYSVSNPQAQSLEVYIPEANSAVEWKTATESASVTCTPVQATTLNDYFYCKNSCTNSFVARYMEAGKYKNCQELASVN